MAKAIRCKVVTPTGVVFEGEVAGIRGPGWEGGFGILYKHAPYLVRLREGRLILQAEDKSERFGLDITAGFLMIAVNDCTVLVEGVREAVGAA